MIINNKKEVYLIRGSIFVTSALLLFMYAELTAQGIVAFRIRDWEQLAAVTLFAVAMFFVFYGNLLYQICLAGNYKRMQKFRHASRDELEAVYDKPAPALTVIIPSYKEEERIVLQTMMSSALAEYPSKNVVLLIDDPYPPKALEDMVKTQRTRDMVLGLQKQFDEPRNRMLAEQTMFLSRRDAGRVYSGIELGRLAHLYEETAEWLETYASNFAGGVAMENLPHSEGFFLDAVVLAPARRHRALALEMRGKMAADSREGEAYIARHYARLVGLYSINFSSFERKRYVNISHEANKAMNLNCYIRLIGKSWREVETDKGVELHECGANEDADFTIPHADYVDTIDADSLMTGDYAIKLINLMEKPGNERLAVVQSPCSSYPGCPNLLERIGGACIDVQFRTHQGYTYWDATFWVGANAMLRKKALEEIREVHQIDGKTVHIYIQDRTVIEDTESTIDLVEKGWKLFNYPERMTFSSTPPDFGSLLIQRRRWSNGGMIILPKLLSYTKKATKNMALLREFFMRFHYLASTTTGVLAALLLMSYPFGYISSTWVLPVSVIPLLMLYARDLKNTGYKGSDVWRICAFNLMVFPVAVGGVMKQFQQMITGKKIPFGRTPKVTGRTAAPALYCIVEAALFVGFVVATVRNVQLDRDMQAGFSLLNAAFMAYSLYFFIGIKALWEDSIAPVKALWRNTFHHAQVIPLPLRWIPNTLASKRRKRA